MDSTYRLKIKIGPHEFEAEGPAETVKEQFQAFKELISAQPAPPPVPENLNALAEILKSPVPTNPTNNMPANAGELSKILRVEGRTISLTARPTDLDDAALLILFGQKELRQNDAVSGFEMMEGLKSTGGYAVNRVDRLLEGLAREGTVIVIGEHRAKRYRLTNTGYARAVQVAKDLAAMVP
jgi:hypothetical protein